MKRLISLTICLLFFSGFVIGQDDLEKKLNESIGETSRDSKDWKVFNFENDSIQIAFPSQPKLETDEFKQGTFRAKLFTYSAEGQDQFFLFSYLNFENEVDFSGVVDSLYEGWVEGLEESFKTANLKSEKSTFLGNEAVKVSIDDKGFYGTGIGVFINGKMFQMLVMNIKTEEYELLEKVNERWSSKFFNSFKVNDQTKVVRVNKLGNDLYKNDFYKFEIALPTNWNKISSDDSQTLARLSKNDNEINNQGRKELEKSIGQSDFLFSYSKKPLGNRANASFICVVERMPNSTATTRQIALASLQNFENNMGYKIISTAKKTRLGGEIFYIIKMEKSITGETVKQNIYFRKINNNELLQFGLTYKKDFDLKEMEKSLATLKFIK